MEITVSILHSIFIHVILVIPWYVALYLLCKHHVMLVRLCSNIFFLFWNKTYHILSETYYCQKSEAISRNLNHIDWTLHGYPFASPGLIFFPSKSPTTCRKKWYFPSYQFPLHGINNGIISLLLVLLTTPGICRLQKSGELFICPG